jgi:hypothetical protein
VVSFARVACGLLQGKTGLVLSHWIKRLEDLWIKLLSHGGFSNKSTRCLVKCL